MRETILLSIMLGALAGQAQAEPRVLTEMPFEYREGLIWLRVTPPRSAQPLNFLLDSGAAASVLDEQTAQRLGVKRLGSVKVRGVHSQTTGYWTRPLSLRAGPVVLPEKWLVADLGRLGRAVKRPIHGLVGADFFLGRVVEIDFAAQTFRLLSEARPDSDAQVLQLRTRRGVMSVPVAVEGSQPSWVRLDTGCASALQWVAGEAMPSIRRGEVSVGLQALTIPVAPASVQIGKIQLTSVPVGWHERTIFHGESGLLGNGLLSQFKLTIDPKAGRVFLNKYANAKSERPNK
jgi:hypothetical protein